MAYNRWSDYANYQATMAGIPDEGGDILNTVLEAILKKDIPHMESLLEKKKGIYTDLDFFILRMIKLNAHSPTSPYRHKTRTVPQDKNIDPFSVEREASDEPEPDTSMVILEKCRQARDILEGLDIPDIEKEIFSWKFFADNPLRSWEGPESYSVVKSVYNRVKRQMIQKVKNPHSRKRRWTPKEIRYLKAEFPHIETMKIAVYLDRNYKSVERKAGELGIKKTAFFKRKRLKKNSPMCF